VLNAYQRSEDPQAALRADRLVRRMEQLFEAGEIDVPPDTYHYTILCGTWARSGDKFAAERVLQILVHMVERSSMFKIFSILIASFVVLLQLCLFFFLQRPGFQT